jgi:putative ABC transport system permease protein
MFKNYFKIAYRNIARHKMFSFINIFGLALSMSVCLLVLVRIKDQVGYDKFHPHSDRTYRLVSRVTNEQGEAFNMAATPLPLASSLTKDYNVVEKSVRIYPFGTKSVSSQKKELKMNSAFTDPAFFDLFGFTLQAGDKQKVLSEPNSIVLSKTTAGRFFGKTNAVGQVLSFGDFGDFKVTGVLDKPAGKSHIDYEAYISMSSVPVLERSGKLTAALDQWGVGRSAYTYVLLKDGVKEKQLASATAQLATLLTKNSNLKGKETFTFDPQPFNDIILGEEFSYNMGNTGSRSKVLAEIGIAFILLLSACFNYTNLSLARSLRRGKEVGVRKVAGANRYQVFYQFIVESVFVSLLSLALAFVFYRLITDYAPFAGELIPADLKIDTSMILWFLLFSVFTGLLAGSLPAWALSAFKPVEVLKNLSNINLFGSNGLRKGLIVVQFALSLIIIVFTATFYKQFQYMADGDPGFNTRNIVNVSLNETNYKTISQEIASLNGVESISATSTNLGRSASGEISAKTAPGKEPLYMEYYDVDPNFISNMRLSLIAGKTFTETTQTKESQVIITDLTRKILQYKQPDDAIGQTLWITDSVQVQIAGVIKDFYYRGLETQFGPMMLRNRPKEFKYLHVKTSVANDKAMLAAIEKVWKKTNPNKAFEATWLYDEIYERKGAWGTVSMLGFLAIITITLACLGLLGMVVYNTETKKKEIGIRKVMGASVSAIVSLLSKNFVRLVVVAGLIALPVSYALSYFFLMIFANRIDIGFGILALSFGGMLLLSLVTISSQVFRFAVANPVESLRTE